MKFTFLFFFLLLSSHHLPAQENKKDSKGIKTINVNSESRQKDTVPTIFTVAEQMPMFPDSTCMSLTSYQEQKTCADQKLLSFIFNHIRCPNSIKEIGIELTVIVSFIVDIDGSLRDFKILKGNNPPAFAQEFIRVIQLTTEKNGPWVPAMLRGQAVPLLIKLPLKLNLR